MSIIKETKNDIFSRPYEARWCVTGNVRTKSLHSFFSLHFHCLLHANPIPTAASHTHICARPSFLARKSHWPIRSMEQMFTANGSVPCEQVRSRFLPPNMNSWSLAINTEVVNAICVSLLLQLSFSIRNATIAQNRLQRILNFENELNAENHSVSAMARMRSI